MPSNIERAVIFVAADVLGGRPVAAGEYPALDWLAKRGQCGYLSTFRGCSDIVAQVTGINYHGAEGLRAAVGPMRLSVLVRASKYSGFGDVESIAELKEEGQICDTVRARLSDHSVVLVEMADLRAVNDAVELMRGDIDEHNVAVCVVLGYKEGGAVPKFRAPPPCVDPSWKIVGPSVVDSLGLEKPCIFVSASARLTRVDNVSAFDESDIYQNNCMGVLPICQIFREFSYYTGSSWKYGA